eukprot:6212308-Pleurochrysis_carterae.AAC.6
MPAKNVRHSERIYNTDAAANDDDDDDDGADADAAPARDPLATSALLSFGHHAATYKLECIRL